MRLSLFSGATLLACGFSVSGRPLSPQEETGDLYGVSDFFQGVDGQSNPSIVNPPSLGTSFGLYDANLPINHPDTPWDVNKIISSTFSSNVDESSNLPVISASTSSGLYDNNLPITVPDTSKGLYPDLISLTWPPDSRDSQGPSDETIFPPNRIPDIKITADVLNTLDQISTGGCRYEVWEYNNDGNLKFKKCGTSVSRNEISNAITESGWGFTVAQLSGKLILSIHNEYRKGNLVNSLDNDAWVRALEKKFPSQTVNSPFVFNQVSLKNFLDDFDSWWD